MFSNSDMFVVLAVHRSAAQKSVRQERVFCVMSDVFFERRVGMVWYYLWYTISTIHNIMYSYDNLYDTIWYHTILW